MSLLGKIQEVRVLLANSSRHLDITEWHDKYKVTHLGDRHRVTSTEFKAYEEHEAFQQQAIDLMFPERSQSDISLVASINQTRRLLRQVKI